MKAILLRLALLVSALPAWSQIPRPTDAPRPMTPEQSAAAFKLPAGFRMEVIASEPLIASPSGVCWDERGRMFVSELHGYNLEGQLDIEELNKTGQLDTQVRRVQAEEKFKQAAEKGTFGVVKLLLDTDGDGRMDKAVTWATNLPPAYGLVPARGGVIVACAPDIVYLADRDGDGVAEVQEKLFTGFRTGALERGINAPQWSADGWIYLGRGWGGGTITGPQLAKPVQLPGSDFRIRADGSAIEPVTGGSGTFGFAMTEAGDRFTMSTSEPGRFVAPLPWVYLVRNPDSAATGLEVATGDRRVYPLAPPHPWRQKRAEDAAYFKYYRDRYGAGDSDASGWFTSACSPLIYRDSVLPALRGQYFVCDPAGNLIHRALVEEDGSALKLRRASGEEKSEFAATTDQWCHPMSLTHGPDGCIWITDYYREIIEDYSAIPRHLQQQYGVFAGHDRGRIYRLTHRDARRAPAADMSKFDAQSLARECGNDLLWRRQTAQRLLVERGEKSAAPVLREILANKASEPSAIITALRTLDQLGEADVLGGERGRLARTVRRPAEQNQRVDKSDTRAPVERSNAVGGTPTAATGTVALPISTVVLTPADVQPFLTHADAAVRVHALQLADRWFAKLEGRELLEAALAAVSRESNARVLIQFALSLGEARDTRAFAALTRLARERLVVRWMDAALLSGLAGRGADMLSELLREPGNSEKFLPLLAQAIAARRDETELARTLKLLTYAKPATQSAVLDGLAKGRKNAPRKPLADKFARAALAEFTTNATPAVSQSARALAETFVTAAVDDDSSAGTTAATEQVSEETYRKFLGALASPRDLPRGHEIFLQACAPCHRIGNEGHEVGPDLFGQLGMSEESLLHDLLTPSARIRPGYETTEVKLQDGSVAAGLLKDDGATSLTLMQAGGVEQVLLRKNVDGVRRLATSLMPSFAEALTASDVANLLAWLRSNLDQKVVNPTKNSAQSPAQP